MSDATTTMLKTIASREGAMLDRLRAWSQINSGSTNIEGIRRQRLAVSDVLGPLADEAEVIVLPNRTVVDELGEVAHLPVAEAAVFRKRTRAATRVLLSGHLDTVFPVDSPFQEVREEGQRWIGPGVADLKGGLVVMAEALAAFEQHPLASRMGWTVVLNPDEEVSSPSSRPLLESLAKDHAVGLVYEPALADGRLAGDRGGNGSFHLVIRGKSAHVGRDFELGRSAMHVAGEVVALLANLNQADGVIVNVGKIDGGGPVNRVADLAVIRFNVRVSDDEKRQAIESDLRRLATVLGRRDGITATLHGSISHPPKLVEGKTAELFKRVADCGKQIGLDLSWSRTGGVCDGNVLQAAGLPTVDTLGVRGGGLHTDEEFVEIGSLVERVQLSALLLASLASDAGG